MVAGVNATAENGKIYILAPHTGPRTSLNVLIGNICPLSSLVTCVKAFLMPPASVVQNPIDPEIRFNAAVIIRALQTVTKKSKIEMGEVGGFIKIAMMMKSRPIIKLFARPPSCLTYKKSAGFRGLSR